MPPLDRQSREDLKQLSDAELKRYLELAADQTTGRKLAMEELARRQTSISKSRWKLNLKICLVILASILLFLGAIVLARRRF